jgi:hypothetical protein
MFALLIIITVLTVLYGLAWHDRPASQAERVRRSNRK